MMMEKERKTTAENCHRGGKPEKEGNSSSQNSSVEPLPESSRPRRDGPGGE